MSFKSYSETREVYGISPEEKQRIIDFLQGAVYSWCKNRPNEWFSIRDLMGGDNFYWEDTPLEALFIKHTNQGKNGEDATKDAGKDAGWLLKYTLNEDRREFDIKKEDLVNKYQWIIVDESELSH